MFSEVPVDVYVSESYAYFETESGVLIEVGNSVGPYGRDLYVIDDNVVYPESNEGFAKTVQQWDIDIDFDEPVEEDVILKICETSAGRFMVSSEDTTVPVHPFEVVDMKGDVYEVFGAYMPRSVSKDTTIGIEAIDEAVILRNVETDMQNGIEKEAFAEMFDEDQLRAVLKID